MVGKDACFRALAHSSSVMANAPHNLMRPAPIIIAAMATDEVDRFHPPSPPQSLALAVAAPAIAAEVSGFNEAALIYMC